MRYIQRYPLDITGRDPNNLIKGETHKLKDMRFRAISPYYGAFFGDSVKVHDIINNRTLVRNKDYVTAEVLIDKTELTGQAVNGIILIINRHVGEDIKIDYQCLGGDTFRNNQSLENLLKVEHDDEVSYSYLDINKKPKKFQPSFHKHNVAEIFGFDYIVYLLENIRNAIIWKKIDLLRDLIDRMDQEVSDITQDTINGCDEALNAFLIDFKYAFKKNIYDLDLIKNYRVATQYEGLAIADGVRINMIEEAYVTLQSISLFKTQLYSFLLSKKKTGLALDHGIVGNPTKEYLAMAVNGCRFFIDSHDVAVKTNQPMDLTVFPDINAKRTKFCIYKVSNFSEGRGGTFLATNLITATTYIGKLTQYADDLLMEWKQLQLTTITDECFAQVIDHLGDDNNPHKDNKECVGFDLLENLPTATKEDVLAQIPVRKYITAENLQLYMKGFMAGQADTNEIKADPRVNVMKRFDIIFSDCSDSLVSSGSQVCNIEEIDLSFTVYTQRVRYRNAKRIAQDPSLTDYNPVIYEAFTKLNGKTLSVEHSLRSGIRLVNLPQVLGINQSWNYGTLYHGFRSGVYSYETTDPYYDTLLVVRGAKTPPTINGVIEVLYIKSYAELLDEFGGVQGIADEFEFQMKKGDYLVCFRAFNKPPANSDEQDILDFEKKEQVAKVEIFSTGYTFYIDLRTAVFEDFHYITLKEKNSPKVIPSIHYPVPTEDWFNNKRPQEGPGVISTVVVGTVSQGSITIDIDPDEQLGINTLIENYKDNPRRAGYINGTLGMSVIKLNNDGTQAVDYPTAVDELPKDDFYDGILGVSIENDKASVIFEEQLDLARSINYNVYVDPFVDVPNVTRPVPYDNFNFSNPYASGNTSVGDTRYEAFIEYMRLGFNRVNALDRVTERLNSSKGHLTLRVKNPGDQEEEFIVDIEENLRLNRELFKTLYDNYVDNNKRKKYWGQPTSTMPYTELLEIPKRFVNQYKREYTILEEDGHRQLVETDVKSPDNIVIDIIEVGRLESDYILAGYETIQYNALFNNVAILKNWRFKDVKKVIDIDKYIEGETYPVYPQHNVDRTISEDEKDVTIYSVFDLTFSKELKYAKGMYGCKSFKAMAINDIERREITIELPEHIYDEITEEIGISVAGDDVYQVSEDGFSTFNIMHGVYDFNNHMKLNRDTKTVKINMSHVGPDHQSIFFKHHLKYIQWNVKIELAPTVLTSVLYPIIQNDNIKAKATFVGASYSNFAKYINKEDYTWTNFTFTYAGIRKMINEVKISDKFSTDFSFINADVKKVLLSTGYSDDFSANFELTDVSFRRVVDYVVYRNYEPERIRSKFELLDINIKTVRVP